MDCTPSKTIVSSTVQFGNNKKNLNVLRQSGEGNQILDATRDLKFQIIQQLNFITRALNFHITVVDKAKCDEYRQFWILCGI